MRIKILFIFFLVAFNMSGQEPQTVLKFNEYLAFVKKFHPVARQAELTIDSGQAELMKSRGAFDPKIEVDYNKKLFKGTEYYEKLNSTFKIPVWYGIDFKAKYDQNEGEYLNPMDNVPEDGLYSAGVTVSVGQGLWMNDRMATLKKAKIFREQSKVDRDLQVNQILYEASMAYFKWLQAYRDQQTFSQFLSNAEIRFESIRTSALSGELAAIDTVEAKITVQDRQLRLEQSKISLIHASLELSSFLWLDNVPVELQPEVVPDIQIDGIVDTTLEIAGKPLDSFPLENHPKLRSLDFKVQSLVVDKRLKTNKLLPKIDLEYNFLTETPEYINSFQDDAYKAGLSFSLPLFLRKERGDLKLAKIKLQYARLDYDNAEIKIRNKIVGLYQELDSYETQQLLMGDMVDNYERMLSAEERKFMLGESSLFLVNSRESKLIDATLKRNEIQNKFYSAKAKLFNSIGQAPQNL
ncbi:MAG: transporter [Pseudozobellia sp.]|nr:transporter [Pseudozobellia sp.]MBG48791.1 transporter [Pseudozobellia sp.]|tara:strand:- start:198 stop:1595 length:1398 start_codon:yes stop_codon:yes gene_type:complete